MWSSILPEETSAKAAYRGARGPAPNPQGGQKLTWLKIIENDLKDIKAKLKVINRDGDGNIENKYQVYDHEHLAKNRHIW